MTLTLIVLGLTVALFIWGRIRSDVVALSALAVLMVSGVLSPTEALAGFSSSVVIMMAGLFVVGGAIFQTGLARETGKRMMGLAQGNETRAFLLVMLTTSVIGAFVSNTGTVALMMPIIVSMAAQAGFSSGRMRHAPRLRRQSGRYAHAHWYASEPRHQRGADRGRLRGTLVFLFPACGFDRDRHRCGLSLPLSKTLVRKQRAKRDTEADKSLNDLVEEYQLADSLRRYYVPAGSGMVGRMVSELAVKTRHGVTILEIRNEENTALGMVRNVSQSIVTGDTVIGKGDILYLVGRKEGMEELEHEWGLERMKGATIDFYDIGIAELVLLPSSKLVGATISESRPREQYGLTVLGIRRGEEYIYDDLGEKHLHGGDVLLVQAQWEDLLALDNELDNWVVMGRPDKSISKVTLDYKAPMAALIMLLMVVVMVMGWAEPVTAVIVAALLTVLTGCFRKVEDAYKTINWESLVLIAAMMPMSTALEKTGVSAMVSAQLVGVLGEAGPYALLAGIYFTTSLLTMFISNTATAVLMAPIAFTAAQQTGVSPYAFLLAVTLGASMCFASPFSTPPNALVMKAGHYTFMDYVRIGLPLQVIIGVAMTFLLPMLFEL